MRTINVLKTNVGYAVCLLYRLLRLIQTYLTNKHCSLLRNLVLNKKIEITDIPQTFSNTCIPQQKQLGTVRDSELKKNHKIGTAKNRQKPTQMGMYHFSDQEEEIILAKNLVVTNNLRCPYPPSYAD